MTHEFINTIRWRDVFDILLMSYILFRLYVLFKGTNVFRVLIGILVLWFFQKIAFYMGLIVTSWAVQSFTAVAAIIIIVIFRNEIRTVLQAKNFRALFWDFPHHELDTPVDIISESVFAMASKGTGAIIVIPGKEDIYDSVHSGINWDGSISKEMIMSIFWHENPVHDGAAIVTGDRVKQVGAVLPLSHRKDLPSHYGMRHRAAQYPPVEHSRQNKIIGEKSGAFDFLGRIQHGHAGSYDIQFFFHQNLLYRAGKLGGWEAWKLGKPDRTFYHRHPGPPTFYP